MGTQQNRFTLKFFVYLNLCSIVNISACGYCGSDGVVVMVLQKYSDAKRVYASIMQCKAQVKTPMARGILRDADTTNPVNTFITYFVI